MSNLRNFRLCLALLFCLGFCAAAASAPDDKASSAPPMEVKPRTLIKLAFFALVPHNYLDTERQPYKGASLVYIERQLRGAGYDVDWIGPLSISRIQALAEQGAIDGTVFFLKTKEREATFAYPKHPYVSSRAILALRAENPLRRIQSIHDIKGWTITYVAHGANPEFLTNAGDMVNLYQIASEGWLEQSMQMLNRGRTDAVLGMNEWSLPYVAKTMDRAMEYRFVDLPEKPQPFYLAFARASVHMPELLQRYNQQYPHFNDKPYRDLLNSYLK